MDFREIEIDERMRQFWTEVRTFVNDNVTEDLAVRDDVNAHDARLNHALGEKGWNLPRRPRAEWGAGLDALQAYIIERELRRSSAPLMARQLSLLILPAIEQYGQDDLRAEIVEKVAKGEVTMCLGYTEPDAGSDLAGIKTRAERDGDHWVLNGSKMFTTAAQHCQYSFLLARTDPAAKKHQGLTMFLVPLDSPGVEIRPIDTLGDEKTNLVFYTGVRISDRYRLGAEGDGWRVVSGPLNEEHGIGRDDEYHLAEINPIGSTDARNLDRLVAEAVAWAVDSSRSQDPTVRRRIAEVALDTEVSRNTPGPMGRVVTSETLIRRSAELVDLIGPRALLPKGSEGALPDGLIEWAHRHAQGTAIYGGTTDIFRNIIAQRVLHLPRPRVAN
jgi:alkylation response protein AidB-like acyl-CoA dehydrogenase